jgi:hypothetical protein
MICVSTKDPHSLSFRQNVAGYSEDLLRKIGLRKRGFILNTLKMIRLGYFLFTINHNSKLNMQARRYSTITKV